ncbi:MAG: hypothetical protein M3256_25245 [Actinomycetota bacterium]|nr:hypothetical protein [Actinomycetota bacterium]MDQ6949465.1 hypothetical protein [Actinomycetota bacterium]
MAIPRKNKLTVKKGRVGKTQNWRSTPGAEVLAGTDVVFERRRPGKGYRHVLNKTDIERFIALLPDWEEVSHGLEAIVLLPGRDDVEGVYVSPWVGIYAWSRALWWLYDASHFENPRESITRLGVPFEPLDGGFVAKWTDETVRAYQLLDVLVHELGHHHDRMSTRGKLRSARGERYAEEYARRYSDHIWEAYCIEFDLVIPPTSA